MNFCLSFLPFEACYMVPLMTIAAVITTVYAKVHQENTLYPHVSLAVRETHFPRSPLPNPLSFHWPKLCHTSMLNPTTGKGNWVTRLAKITHDMIRSLNWEGRPSTWMSHTPVTVRNRKPTKPWLRQCGRTVGWPSVPSTPFSMPTERPFCAD